MGAYEPDNRLIPGSQPASGGLKAYAVSFSRGIRRIRHIHTFLSVAAVVSPWQARRRALDVSCVVVWGRKQNSHAALRYADVHNLPVRFVEDGWIRSCSANAHSRLSYSMLVDEQGVYYDSSKPSALESFLNLPDDTFDKHCSATELAYANRCLKILIESNITKYNFVRQPATETLHGDTRTLVLVLDQTCDDASVKYGAMNAELFCAMLHRAVQENPDARVVMRTHPDVVAGRRQGYLQDTARELGVEISAAGDNPIPWLKAASIVYAGTSQLGYEALLCGCAVKVAGQPFYAGWGLTEDFQPVSRRIRLRTLDQLFHATHVQHARYCCPVTGQQWKLHDCLEHVQLQQKYFLRNAGQRVAIGFTPWKHRYLAQFLRSPEGSLRFSSRDDTRADEVAVRWSYSDEPQPCEPLQSSSPGKSNAECVRVEDGFIRSRGLGSDFAAPASLVFDKMALYFHAGKASELETMLNDYRCSAAELDRAAALRQRLLATNLTKYNVGTLEHKSFISQCSDNLSKRLLVIGQVEGDQSLIRGGRDIFTNKELLEAVRENNPQAFVVYKPHPDVVSGNRRGIIEADVIARCVDTVESSRHLLDCLKECDELHTMTSLAGFEALMRGKTVVTYGSPFYAGWGLTRDLHPCERRTKLRSVDELVYLSLICYPHYVDLDSGEFASVEQLVEKLQINSSDVPKDTGLRWVRKLSNIKASLVYQA